ncbi:MAG: PAS domain S-box protein [Candidatus Riflebacteria bacterium]|nr:PAS domain S-box protein [Candidatus Riflebacteria bacterium]
MSEHVKDYLNDKSVERTQQEDLRKRAEEVVRCKTTLKHANIETITNEEVHKLLHELQVHQVELETQNEELRRRQIELEAANSRYFDLYELAPIGYLTINDDDVVIEANLTSANLLGVNKTSILKMKLTSFIFSEDQDTFFRFYRKLHLSDLPHVCELRMKRPGKDFFWARLESKPMLGIDGRRIYVTAISDISQSRQTEEKLQASEARIASILEDQTELICRYLPNGKLTFVNDAYLRYFSKNRKELLEHNFIPHIPEPDMKMILERTKDISREKPIADFEHRVIMPNGEIRWQHWIHRGIFNLKGTLEEYQAVGRDITEKKIAATTQVEIERLLIHSQKLECLEKMAGGVAHDLNNLLAIINFNLEMLRQQLSPENYQFHFNLMEDTLERATGLAKKMLDFSGKSHLTLNKVQLNNTIKNSLQHFSSSLSKDVKLSLDLNENLPCTLADEEQIEQVILNLLSNGFEALMGKPGTLSVSSKVLECSASFLQAARKEAKVSPGRYVAIEVRDTGCGMDKETEARIFDPFFTTKFIGRGLGLSAVLGIVKGHRGTIMVDSLLGCGTLIQILLPVSEPEVPAIPIEHSANKIEPTSSNKKTSGALLVVDDEKMICNLCSKWLKGKGYHVLTANNGHEGVEVFRKNADSIVCVILDLTMPIMDGWTTFAQIREIKSDARIILTSGFSEENALSRFGKDKPDLFIQKPFSLQTLNEKIIQLTGCVIENQ